MFRNKRKSFIHVLTYNQSLTILNSRRKIHVTILSQIIKYFALPQSLVLYCIKRKKIYILYILYMSMMQKIFSESISYSLEWRNDKIEFAIDGSCGRWRWRHLIFEVFDPLLPSSPLSLSILGNPKLQHNYGQNYVLKNC